MGDVSALVIDPSTPTTVYAGADSGGGISESTDSGATWSAANTGLTDMWVLALAIDPTNPATLYAGTYGGGALKSTDSGSTWAEASAGLTLTWHLVGHLQSNKARKAVASFGVIHSVDSLDLLQHLERATADVGRRPQVLVQVDLAGEATKFGAPPDETSAIVRAAAACRTLLPLLSGQHRGCDQGGGAGGPDGGGRSQ